MQRRKNVGEFSKPLSRVLLAADVTLENVLASRGSPVATNTCAYFSIPCDIFRHSIDEFSMNASIRSKNT